MIPRTLDEWDVAAIERLLTQGYYETEQFDFKEKLPSSKDQTDRDRLVKSCCAFANTDTGFLIFGVTDKRSDPIDARLVGMDRNTDFPEQFGNYPRKCTPSVEWGFRNPPIALPSGRIIQVVQIPRSWSAPYCYRTPDEVFLFVKRTNKGNESMSYEEVRLLFLGYYEKRVKLQLLLAELRNIGEAARSMVLPHDKWETEIPFTTFHLGVLESVLSDTYTMLAGDAVVLGLLTEIRNRCMTVNNRSQAVFSIAGEFRTGQKNIYRRHNSAIHPECPRIEYCCSEAANRVSALAGT